MYNPAVKLNPLIAGATWAKLEATEVKDLVFDFILNPEEVVWDCTANFKENNVLYTGQPQLWYTNSSTSLSLPEVKIMTPNNTGDVFLISQVLKNMTKPLKDKNRPPMLQLTWGNLSEKVYLSKFNLREQQWRSGRVTSAIATLDFLLIPPEPKPEVVNNGTKPVVLSDRERKEYEKIIQKKLKDKNFFERWVLDPLGSAANAAGSAIGNAANSAGSAISSAATRAGDAFVRTRKREDDRERQRLNTLVVKPTQQVVKVTSDGIVSIGGQIKGTIGDMIPEDVKQAHKRGMAGGSAGLAGTGTALEILGIKPSK